MPFHRFLGVINEQQRAAERMRTVESATHACVQTDVPDEVSKTTAKARPVDRVVAMRVDVVTHYVAVARMVSMRRGLIDVVV